VAALLFVFLSYGDQDDAMDEECRKHGKENGWVWGGGGGGGARVLLGRSWLRFEGSVKVFLKEMGWEDVD